MELKIMTYNIASGRYYGEDATITPEGRAPVDLSQCAAVIRDLASDLSATGPKGLRTRLFDDEWDRKYIQGLPSEH